MWRIYLDNIEDKVLLLNQGIALRGRVYPVLSTNPNRLDGENTITIKVMDIPLSVDDGVISRALVMKKLEVISISRDKLRINGKLTNCKTGDRSVIVKASSLSEPLPKFMSFGRFQARIYHRGQVKRVEKCTKCLEEGHRVSSCPNEWKCTKCMKFGHKKSECEEASDAESEMTDLADDSDTETAESQPSALKPVIEETPESSTEETPKKDKQKKNRKGKPTPGQHDIMKYIKESKLSSNTPNMGRSGNASRPPPSPLDDNPVETRTTKKHKNGK